MTRVVVVVSGGIAQQVLSHGEDVKNLVLYRDPAACKDHNHLYHGTQVNNQVPPA